MPGKNLIEVQNLVKHFSLSKSIGFGTKNLVKAVDGVSFSIMPGETLSLVGESGCGKSTTGRAILQLIKPTSGSIFFEGREITSLPLKEIRNMRQKMQIIFQDPGSTLDQRMTIGDAIAEPFLIHNTLGKKDIPQKVAEIMNLVALDPDFAKRYPHEFSGGQRQRIGIARAIALSPKFVVCDEPVSALDVSIKSQILNLLKDLQEKLHLTYLFISHDLGVVRQISNSLAIMYLGRIVEIGAVESIFNNPLHPYTRALLSAVPRIDKNKRTEKILLPGSIPSPINPPPGCHFHTRCPEAIEDCRKVSPQLRKLNQEQWCACIRR
jgi:oligopeptide transport system ATP-binding protein